MVNAANTNYIKYFCTVTVLLFQTFRTSSFQYNNLVESEFFNARIVTIADAIGSGEQKRCSVEGVVVEVNHCFLYNVSSVCPMILH